MAKVCRDRRLPESSKVFEAQVLLLQEERKLQRDPMSEGGLISLETSTRRSLNFQEWVDYTKLVKAKEQIDTLQYQIEKVQQTAISKLSYDRHMLSDHDEARTRQLIAGTADYELMRKTQDIWHDILPGVHGKTMDGEIRCLYKHARHEEPLMHYIHRMAWTNAYHAKERELMYEKYSVELAREFNLFSKELYAKEAEIIEAAITDSILETVLSEFDCSSGSEVLALG